MSEHLDLDALADVLAGERAADEHLAGCAGCRARLAELEAALVPVAAALAALPEPAEPSRLAGRLDAALAQARQAPAAARTSTAATVTPLAGRPASRRWLPVAGGVAAAAVLVLGGALAVNQARDDEASTSSTAAKPSYQVSSTGTRYDRSAFALRAALPALLSGRAADSAEAASPTVAGGTDGKRAPTADPLAGLRTTSGLASCLASLSDPSDPGLPLALDYAQFEGKPALVVVLPSSKADKVDVFVVGAACAQADADVLFFTRLPKP